MIDDRDPPAQASRTGGPIAWLRGVSPSRWLVVAVVAYFAVSFALSWLRAIEFQTSTWDQGLYQQALWSTAHGRPFYEAADLETGGYRSLLQVHTVFLFYLLAPLYALFPYETTLFAVQSFAVATAAIPLYFLSRDLTHSSRLALVPAVMYLAWTPTLSSNLYDFHPEAFLPLELFLVILLWERERYLLGAAVATVAAATIELAPVLLFFVGVFFLLPSQQTWQRWAANGGVGRRWWLGLRGLREAFASPRVRASVALLGGSLFAYFLLLFLRVDALAATLGTSSLAAPPTGYVIGGTPSSLGLSLQNLGTGFYSKLTYWILVLALLGFVPLLMPRALVLSVPWFGFTMLSSNLNYVELGFQYGFIAAASLLVAFAYGLPRAVAILRHAASGALGTARTGSSIEGIHGPVPVPRSWSRTIIAALVILLTVNVALSPANPLMQNNGLGSAYRISYTSSTGFADAEELVGLIPVGASVVASDNLFPLVANDENAYSFFWTQNDLLALPFNGTDLPQYVLLASDATVAVPAWLAAELYSNAAFGARGVVWSSSAGPILLFERGYEGPVTIYGSSPPVPIIDTGSTVLNQSAGYLTTVPGSAAGEVAASIPGVPGAFIDGPRANLPGGNYSVTLLLSASAVPGASPPSGLEPVLSLGVTAFAQPRPFSENLTFGALSTPGWTTVTFHVVLPGPTLRFAVEAEVLGTNVQVFLDQLEVAPE